MPKKKKPKAVIVDGVPIKPSSATEHRRLERRIKKKYEKLRRRYPEVHGMEPETFEKALELKFPWIEWRKPLRIASPQGSGLGCRFCIARHGIKAAQIPALPQSIADFHAHMRDFHAVASVAKNGTK